MTSRVIVAPVSSSRLGCYFTNWSQYRPGAGKFLPSDVDPNLCTHLIYAFAGINDANALATIEWNDEVLYNSFNALKERWASLPGHSGTFDLNTKHNHLLICVWLFRNPLLKTLLAVGGWNFGSAKWDGLNLYTMGIISVLQSIISHICSTGLLRWLRRPPAEARSSSPPSACWDYTGLTDWI